MNSKVTTAKVLIVEGWMSYEGLNTALMEFNSGDYETIYLTGGTLHDHVSLSINSYLIIYPTKTILIDSIERKHEFRINVQSSLGESDSAHFVFWINNVDIADYYTTDNNGKFCFTWVGNIIELDSIMIQFDNDKIGKYSDRNLIVKSVLLNDVELLDDKTPRFIDTGRSFGKYRWNILASTYAELSSYFFKANGVCEDRVISVPNKNKAIRRTYGNALALKHWFETNNIHPVAINVISMDYHSRRTWMIYNHLLKDRMEVGIISLDVSHSEKKTLAGQFKTIARELMALLYYCIFIIPWT